MWLYFATHLGTRSAEKGIDMFNSQILEVAIGLGFLYLVLSLLCTTLTEALSRLTGRRAKDLFTSVGMLLQDKKLRDLVYSHPLLESLRAKRLTSKESKDPSYIPSKTFATALIDTIVNGDPSRHNPAETGDRRPLTQGGFTEIVSAIEEANIEKVLADGLVVMFDRSERDTDKAIDEVAQWFDAYMDRASGWYKRKADIVTLVIAAIVTVGLNANTFEVARTLWSDPELRRAIVDQTEETTANTDVDALKEKKPEELEPLLDSFPLGWWRAERGQSAQGDHPRMTDLLEGEIKRLNLALAEANEPKRTITKKITTTTTTTRKIPSDSEEKAVGDDQKDPPEEDTEDPDDSDGEADGNKPNDDVTPEYKVEAAKYYFVGRPNSFTGWSSLVLGLLCTTVMVSLGAPFWFDLLNKLMKLRSTGRKHDSAAVMPPGTADPAGPSGGEPGSPDQPVHPNSSLIFEKSKVGSAITSKPFVPSN